MQYRMTRNRPYPPGTPGFDNLEAREGYYIDADSEQEAHAIMASKFPEDSFFGFELQVWKNQKAA